MKILIDGLIYTSAPSGGAYRYFNELISRLSNFPDTEVNVFTQKDPIGLPTGGNLKVAKDNLPTGKWLPEGALKKHLRQLKRNLQTHLLKKKFSDLNETIFHSTYYTPSPWHNLRQVTTVYDMISELFPETYELDHIKSTRRAKAESIRNATRVIAISENTKRDIQKFYGTDSSMIDVIHLGVDFDFFSNPVSPEEKNVFLGKHDLISPYFLFVGGRLHHKNFKRFLKGYASSLASKEHPLVVAGAPWNSEEKQLINSLNLNKKIILIPGVTDPELVILYQNALAFAFPSYYEGFGLPLIEAMAAGCPVIASNCGPFPELSQGAALLFDPYDESQIALALDEVLTKDNRLRLIKAGKKQALNFSWDELTIKHLETYRKALS